LKEIKAVRRIGFFVYIIEIETDDEIRQLPTIAAEKETKTFIKMLIERTGLKKTEWGKKSIGKRVATAIFGRTIMFFGFSSTFFIGLIGVLLIIIGSFLLAIIAIIPGILCFIFGTFALLDAIATGVIGVLGGKLLERREEWKSEDFIIT